jgi:hypothetical protein
VETITQELARLGCTITEVTTLSGSIVVGYAGRDVICFLTQRTKEMQKFADKWKGAPPVNLTKVEHVHELLERILAGEFDADSKYIKKQIILRLRK